MSPSLIGLAVCRGLLNLLGWYCSSLHGSSPPLSDMRWHRCESPHMWYSRFVSFRCHFVFLLASVCLVRAGWTLVFISACMEPETRKPFVAVRCCCSWIFYRATGSERWDENIDNWTKIRQRSLQTSSLNRPTSIHLNIVFFVLRYSANYEWNGLNIFTWNGVFSHFTDYSHLLQLIASIDYGWLLSNALLCLTTDEWKTTLFPQSSILVEYSINSVCYRSQFTIQ